ncbi:E3 ubiquitin-protein ligase ORTHRUS 2 isoform X2 [Physcomitrium patens]|uniref:RING-type E3 ubiquitin transferase n=1 Tax=Physcomitrium patens TaxID=3218 RepID=A0A2K1KVG3_PHYPA|nr:E3 ubiquitin-protein ligase ORTHRUS 2-like isoform X2 [Physcomitrium patens]PNR57736.1 hypothetical protein PHYPA_004730 [Physcomitrium patens]|eukprot:XP_024371573.1 E3 ubiquitin-protein ligase ORTHRUS 2-like isoform X2 [Physcomitrella patens]
MTDLPCDADGKCMVCKIVPPDSDAIMCGSCASPWHMRCLNPPMEFVPLGDWDCPDCSLPPTIATPSAVVNSVPEACLVNKIRAIQADSTLSEAEKAKRRQELMSKGLNDESSAKLSSLNVDKKSADGKKRNATLEMMDNSLNCIFCMQLAERPVTTPCGHNFCLKCFQRWVGQGKKTCGKCRSAIPAKMASNPRINSALVMAIRMARSVGNSNGGPPKTYTYRDNDSRPDKCFTTSRAVKTGKANACSGKIFVTIAPDHFGPITAEHDPTRGQGVLVGECWEDRMECRQWGAHLPHVAGIAGQSDYGSQSVALSGGYEDDEDHGEWFLYTGSGGRDLSGNKRTNKEQSFDQKFDKMNEALRVSCKHGFPVRVVRSHKEKRSAYAPDAGVRYDGVYRIEKCWRKKGIQGHKVCRYLFVRCDNEPAPWTSDEHGDRPRPLPVVEELRSATDVFERKSSPAWAYTEGVGWGWSREPPASKKTSGSGPSEATQKRKQLSVQQRLLKEFGCNACRKVLNQPVSVPCGHNFCKGCLDSVFAGQDTSRERKGVSGRSLRTQKIVKRCPNCKADITDFLVSPQINRQMEEIILTLQSSAKDEQGNDAVEDDDGEDDDSTEAEAQEETKTATVELALPIVANVEECHSEPKVFTPEHPSVPSNDTPENIAESNDTGDPALSALCQAFPDYSEDLLRGMLADQGGDVMELKTVLLALQKQQNQVQSRQRGRIKKGCSSGSEILSNGGNSVAKDLLEEANVDGSAHSSSDQVENDVLNGNGLNTGDSTQAEKANIPPKRQRENETKSNSRKKNRPPLVELPRRISRSRGCKETKVSHVDLTSDGDFQ